LRAYEAALRSIGAKVVRSRLCSEAESAEIEVEVADYAAFRKRFAAHNDLDGLGGVLTKRWLD
jgi:hypothetical protein